MRAAPLPKHTQSPSKIVAVAGAAHRGRANAPTQPSRAHDRVYSSTGGSSHSLAHAVKTTSACLSTPAKIKWPPQPSPRRRRRPPPRRRPTTPPPTGPRRGAAGRAGATQTNTERGAKRAPHTHPRAQTTTTGKRGGRESGSGDSGKKVGRCRRQGSRGAGARRSPSPPPCAPALPPLVHLGHGRSTQRVGERRVGLACRPGRGSQSTGSAPDGREDDLKSGAALPCHLGAGLGQPTQAWLLDHGPEAFFNGASGLSRGAGRIESAA